MNESKTMCNWCGDLMNEGLYEIHHCMEDKEDK